jgi:HlyD family secretion protein
LTAFSITLGQSMQRGEHIGQIDSPGRNKLVADVDEFYLGKVQTGLTASLEQGGKTFALKVAKIYPQVRNGQFQVDLTFSSDEPPIQRGQTLQARLVLGDPAPARLVPNAGWAADTGGNWIFVVAADGSSAVRRDIRVGRRNTEAVEVLAGLEPGERVITSPYAGFVDKTRLVLDAPQDMQRKGN